MAVVEDLKEKSKQLIDENKEAKIMQTQFYIDRDNAYKELKEIKEIKARSDLKMNVYSSSLLEKANKLTLQLTQLNEKYQTLMSELYAKNGVIKNLMAETASLKERISLLRKKKGNLL